jgi:hypothetical protein
MLNEAQLEQFSITELIDSPDRSVQFAEAFAAQFLEIRLAPPAAVNVRVVALDAVVSIASGIGIVVCAYSLLLWFYSGFALIHPLFSVLGIVAGIAFYCMGIRLGRRSG